MREGSRIASASPGAAARDGERGPRRARCCPSADRVGDALESAIGLKIGTKELTSAYVGRAQTIFMKAKKAFFFNAEDLRTKVITDFNNVEVWDTKSEDKSSEDLASDKRAAIQKLLDAEEEEEEMGAAAAAAIENAKTK